MLYTQILLPAHTPGIFLPGWFTCQTAGSLPPLITVPALLLPFSTCPASYTFSLFPAPAANPYNLISQFLI